MDLLDVIKTQGNGSGTGDGSGNGDGYGDGYGNGHGDGYGRGDSYSNGTGTGSGTGSGAGYGNGNGYGDGNGYGTGSGAGNCDGYGNGDGYGTGSGAGNCDGSDIAEFDGVEMYMIDHVPTFIEVVYLGYAKGFTLRHNSVKIPCYVAHIDGHLAHGSTLREAVREAEEKAMMARPVSKRIDEVVKMHPDPNAPISNRNLYRLHHMLTGSCEYGRRQFCERHGIDLNGETTMREFCRLTRDDYGGEIIKQLEEAYDK